MADEPLKEHWHLKKEIPIALIVTFFLTTGAWFWQYAALTNRVDDHARRLLVMEAADTRLAQEAQRLSEQIARLDERMAAQTAILRRIDETLARASLGSPARP